MTSKKQTIPNNENLRKFANYFLIMIEDLYHPNLLDELDELEHSKVFENAKIKELDVRAGAGAQLEVPSEQLIANWELPADWLRAHTSAAPGSLIIITIIGDSMEPTLRPTERVLVDRSDVNPSPPGMFILWGGFGLVAKRLEVMDDSDPLRVRLTSDNPRYGPQERSAGEISIRGRIIGKWQWL